MHNKRKKKYESWDKLAKRNGYRRCCLIRQTQNRNEYGYVVQNNYFLLWIVSFMISIYETLPQFKWQSMSQLKQFKERKGYHGMKTTKTFENENENQYVRHNLRKGRVTKE